MISIYMIPAMLAVVVSLFVIWAASQGSSKSRFFIPMVIAFTLFHITEIVGLILFNQSHTIHSIIRLYYVLSLIGLSLISLYAIEVSKIKVRGVKPAIVAVALTFAFLCFGTDMIIAGVQSVGYSPTVIKGPGYIIFRILSAAFLISIAVFLYQGYCKANSHEVQIQCVYTIYALLPITIICLFLLILMAAGNEISAVGVLPVGSIMFLLITLGSEKRHNLTDIRRLVPGSSERKTSSEIMKVVSRYARDDILYRDAVGEIERLLVTQKYKKNDNNASATAELMGMPRSSLYSLFNRLKIESGNK